MKHLLLVSLSLTSLSAITPSDIEQLIVRQPSPLSSDVSDLTTRGATVVGISSKGEVAASLDDGATWSAQAKLTVEEDGSTLPLVFTSITNSTNTWLAVSQGGYASRSTDLTQWQTVRLPLSSAVDVTYAEGLFVAVSADGMISTSEDEGSTWTNRDLQTNVNNLTSITHANDTFVAVGRGIILSSPDAITWTSHDLSLTSNDRFRQVNFVTGLFIATGTRGLIFTSADGTNWTRRDIGTLKSLDYPAIEEPAGQISLVNGRNFIQLGGDLASSSEVPAPAFLTNGIRTTSGGVIGSGPSAILQYRPNDTSDFSNQLETFGNLFDGVTFGKGLFVTVGTSSRKILTSSDGIQWTERFQAEDNFESDIVFNGETFAILDESGNAIISQDGLSWAIASSNLGRPRQLKFLNGRWIALRSNREIAESSDLINWTFHTVGEDLDIRSVGFGKGLYIASGSSVLQTSPDLKNWTPRTVMNATKNSYREVVFGNDRFMLFNSFAPPAISEDGITWVELPNPGMSTGSGSAVGYDDELGFYSVGIADDDIAYWPKDSLLEEPVQSRKYAATLRLDSIIEGNGIVVGVGFNGIIMSSPIASDNYTAWVAVNFSAEATEPVTGFLRDPDSDGLSNLEEYARGTNPNLKNLPLAFIIEGSQIRFSQRSGLTDLTSTIEHSIDLRTWSGEAISTTILDLGNGSESVTGTLDDSPDTKLFFRANWSFSE